jgi:hypothetical protein
MSTIDFPEIVDEANECIFRIEAGMDGRDGTSGSDML